MKMFRVGNLCGNDIQGEDCPRDFNIKNIKQLLHSSYMKLNFFEKNLHADKVSSRQKADIQVN